MRVADLPSNIRNRVTVSEDGCWLWTGHIAHGYGHVSIAGKRHYLHRLAYEALVGPIPNGLQIDHLCRVKHCCNPSHLEPVTQAENLRRGQGIGAKNAAKTHCKNGHEFTQENTRIVPTSAGPGRGRKCRVCDRARPSRRRLKRQIPRDGGV